MPEPFPAVIVLDSWPDDLTDDVGFEPTSRYFEWLSVPTVGPSGCVGLNGEIAIASDPAL